MMHEMTFAAISTTLNFSHAKFAKCAKFWDYFAGLAYFA